MAIKEPLYLHINVPQSLCGWTTFNCLLLPSNLGFSADTPEKDINASYCDWLMLESWAEAPMPIRIKVYCGREQIGRMISYPNEHAL